MLIQYMYFVPIELHGYLKQFLKTVIRNKAAKQWQVYRRLDGTTIRLQNVTGVLVFY